MKKLIVYYSYSGNTARLAQARAAKEGAELLEIKDKKRPGMMRAFFVGCPASVMGKPTAIQPITAELSAYDRIVIMAPVWAGNLAPAVNNIFPLLPGGMEVEAVAVSSSGTDSPRKKIEQALEARGCKLVAFEGLKS